MRIIQITDLHIGEPGQDTFGIDVRGNFDAILGLARGLRPDLLVVSGDLCFDVGERSIYHWLRERLDGGGIPYEVMSGNHDDPRMLAEAFDRRADLRDGELYYSRAINEKTLLFLDTTPGEVSPAQLNWLSEQLAQQPGEALLFMHHPPLLSGVPHMDKHYALRNRQEVQEQFFAFARPVHIFSGHYHVDKVVCKRNINLYITPSCFFQIDQHCEDFRVDHRRPGLREIHWNGEALMSTVKYVSGGHADED
jgi:Icc protein